MEARVKKSFARLAELVGGGGGGKRCGFNDGELFEYATSALSEAARDGFDPALFDHALQSWLRLELPGARWARVGACVVPSARAPPHSTRRLVCWLRARCHRDDAKVAFALEWLRGLLERDCSDRGALCLHYEFFFFLLEFEKYCINAAKIICLLTEPRDVTPSRAAHVWKISKMHRKPKHYKPMLAILNLFKSINPECTLERLPDCKVEDCFPPIHEMLSKNFRNVQIRCNITQNLATENRLKWWITSDRGHKRNAKSLIPNVEYIHLEHKMYWNKKQCYEFRLLEDFLECNIINGVDVPANILSLFINEAGMHMLLFCNEDLRYRFFNTLYYNLHDNFLQESSLTYEEKKSFLQHIILLEKYFLQGIPVVTKFLASYLPIWNCEDYFEEICSLLEWITFENFDELYNYILKHLEMIYLTSNTMRRCILVNMFKNMYIRIHDRMVANEDDYFLSKKKTYSDVEVLTNLTDFLGYLCDESVHEIYSSPLLRCTYIDAYVTFEELQKNCSKSIWTVIPKTLSYGVLCSLNGFSIDKIVQLFIKYRSLYNKIKLSDGNENVKRQMKLLQYYASDYMSCLWNGEAISSATNGLLLNRLPESALQDVHNNYDDFNKCMHSACHVAFSTQTYMDIPLDRLSEMWTRDDLLSFISIMYPNVSEFVKYMLA